MTRIVVTGIGAVSPLGVGKEALFDGLIASKSGIKKIPDTWFDTSDLATQIAAIVPTHEESPVGLNLETYISSKDQRKMDRFIHLGLVAAELAVEDSGWKPQDAYSLERTGVMIGSGIGGLVTIEENVLILKEKGARRISPFFIPASLINLLSGHLSIKYGFKGPNHAAVTACSTGAHAISDAARLIRAGEADVVVAGGAESAICRVGIAGFNACRALSTRNDEPTKASRPWDKARDGFIMGEGAGVVVLESYEHAKKRGAKIYAELSGYGLSGDAYHLTAPSEDGDGAYRAMKLAVQMSGLSTKDIGYINAHGTSTPAGDLVEVMAMRRLFGNDLDNIAISSTKSSIGHLLGAAGSVEAVIALMALNKGILPPTLNLEDPEEAVAKLNLVPNKAQERSVSHILSNSFGFGGTNISLLFSKV